MGRRQTISKIGAGAGASLIRGEEMVNPHSPVRGGVEGADVIGIEAGAPEHIGPWQGLG
jgi:hypothetical protein